jgi:beta-glucanase (GH16 family)
MKLHYHSFYILISFVTQLSFSQQMPIDFSESSENFVSFGGTSFSIVKDPIDLGNDVGRIVNSGGLWEGAYLNLSRPIDLDFQKTITLSFYSNNSNNHNIVLKLENGANADVEVTKNVSSAGWSHTLVFDFSNAVNSGSSTSIDASGAYNTITVFIDGGNTTSGTYFIDNIDDGSTPVVVPSDPVNDPVYDYLVWSDEFNTTGAINSSNWFHQTIPIINGQNWANGEIQHYTDRITNSYIDNGTLKILAKKESYTKLGVTKQYTSARLNSKFAFTYGKVEIKAKMPFGVGTFPALWMLGQNITESGGYWAATYGTTGWPDCGEIDIIEHWGDNQDFVQSALHNRSSYGGTINKGGRLISNASTEFHVYTLDWNPSKMTFSVDGVVHYVYNPLNKNILNWPYDAPQYLLLNVAILPNIALNFTESAMEIDYVRVYQSNPLSISENIFNDIKVYPNPASAEINISSQLNIDKVELYDITGKLILSKLKSQNTINVNNIKSGLYMLKIYSGDKSSTKKVIIN